MEILRQAGITNTVNLEGDRIVSQTVYLDGQRELVGIMQADVRTLEIKDAWWEVLKAPEDAPEKGLEGVHPVCFPEGTTGDVKGKKALSLFLTQPAGKRIKYLMNQCINGMIQAESYIYKERGFPDKESYNLFWDEAEKDGCRMYSNPAPSDLRWMDYIPQHRRTGILFNRIKNLQIAGEGRRWICCGFFSDSYHQLNVEISCKKEDGTVTACDVEYFRAPGAACFDNRVHGIRLEGKNLYTISKKELVDLFGRSQGCYHLVELTADLAEQIQAARTDRKAGEAL